MVYKKWEVISTIKFWWNFLEFSDIMDLTIQMSIFDNLKRCKTICLKFGDKLLTPLTISGLEAKASICSAIKENLV